MKRNFDSHKESAKLLALGVYLILVIVTLAFGCDANADESKTTIVNQIEASAIKHGVDPRIAVAIAEVESSLNPNAVGALREVGLFQLRPEYHKVKKGDVRANIETAMAYLASLQRRCSHYEEAFFICHNLGPNYRRIKHPRLFPYYKKVLLAVERRHSRNQPRVAASDR